MMFPLKVPYFPVAITYYVVLPNDSLYLSIIIPWAIDIWALFIANNQPKFSKCSNSPIIIDFIRKFPTRK